MEIWAKSGSDYRHSTVKGQGSKNAALPLIISSIFTDRTSILRNVPSELEDVGGILRSLEWLGVVVEQTKDVLSIDAATIKRTDLPPQFSGASRYSLLFLGGLVGRCGVAKIGPAGGCQFGKDRGFDYHQLVLEKFGCELRQEGDWLVGRLVQQKDKEVTLPFPSVGATLQAIIFLTAANRGGLIHNAAIEPEIIDVIDFLNKSGCTISLVGERSFYVTGYPSDGVTHEVPADRIHIATVMAYSIISNTSSIIEWTSPIDLSCLKDTFSALGLTCKPEAKRLVISVDARSKENKFDVTADVYPGFPTDAVPLVVAATIRSGQRVKFYDNVFSGRNSYFQQFTKLGARVTIISDREFVVDGVSSLMASDVSANDIRGSTSLLLAAIQTNKLSRITNARQIARGYERLPLELSEKGFNVHVKSAGDGHTNKQARLLT